MLLCRHDNKKYKGRINNIFYIYIMNRQRILFVRGFATSLSTGTDDYLGIKTLLERHYDFTYFDYEPSEALGVVYKRMCSNIDSVNPDILIGHSLGGGLVAKYVRYHTETINKGVKMAMVKNCHKNRIYHSYN